MIRLHVICEGQTEASFIEAVMGPHFHRIGIQLFAGLLGRPGHKGGNVGYERLLRDARLRLLGDRSAYCTMLIDYYGLPAGFPGKAETQAMTQHRSKASCITQALAAKLEQAVGPEAIRRFIPYVQMYEFEALLFSQPESTAAAIRQPSIATALCEIRNNFATPEEINNGPQTAPSKRIGNLCRGYEKVIHGTLAASSIGLKSIRHECPLFSEWIGCLEALTSNAGQ